MPEAYKFPDETDDTDTKSVEIGNDGGEIEIEIVDDTPQEDRGRKPLGREVDDPSDDELDSYTDGVKKRIKELTHARHDERRAKEATLREKLELEAFTQKLMEENKKLRQNVNSGTEQFAAQAKTLAETEMDKARRQYKEAQESFDSDAILAAQEALFEAKIKLRDAEKFKPTPLQVQEDEVQTTHREPQRVQPDEKTLRWQAKNQWFGANGFEEVTSFALGLHQKLVNSGADPRSDEYFEQINARVKSKFPEVFGETEDKPTSGETPKSRPASVVAPATRSSGAKKVQLTTTQLALAKKFGLTPQQYAAQVAKLENQ
jgi:hypothetical protein